MRQYRIYFLRLHKRSEEHTSELQSRQHLVCRLLLEKKKQMQEHETTTRPQLTPSRLRHSLVSALQQRTGERQIADDAVAVVVGFVFFFFFLMIRRPPRSPLFPYPPLSR